MGLRLGKGKAVNILSFKVGHPRKASSQREAAPGGEEEGEEEEEEGDRAEVHHFRWRGQHCHKGTETHIKTRVSAVFNYLKVLLEK